MNTNPTKTLGIFGNFFYLSVSKKCCVGSTNQSQSQTWNIIIFLFPKQFWATILSNIFYLLLSSPRCLHKKRLLLYLLQTILKRRRRSFAFFSTNPIRGQDPKIRSSKFEQEWSFFCPTKKVRINEKSTSYVTFFLTLKYCKQAIILKRTMSTLHYILYNC